MLYYCLYRARALILQYALVSLSSIYRALVVLDSPRMFSAKFKERAHRMIVGKSNSSAAVLLTLSNKSYPCGLKSWTSRRSCIDPDAQRTRLLRGNQKRAHLRRPCLQLSVRIMAHRKYDVRVLNMRQATQSYHYSSSQTPTYIRTARETTTAAAGGVLHASDRQRSTMQLYNSSIYSYNRLSFHPAL